MAIPAVTAVEIKDSKGAYIRDSRCSRCSRCGRCSRCNSCRVQDNRIGVLDNFTLYMGLSCSFRHRGSLILSVRRTRHSLTAQFIATAHLAGFDASHCNVQLGFTNIAQFICRYEYYHVHNGGPFQKLLVLHGMKGLEHFILFVSCTT